MAATTEEWLKLFIFVFEWIGFAFLLIAVTSFDWHHIQNCTVGLFILWENCKATWISDSPSWLNASRAFIIMGIIAGFVGLVLDLIPYCSSWKYSQNCLKLAAAIVYIFTVIFTMIGAAIFTRDNAKELFSADVVSSSIGDGYGYVLAWIAMVLFIVADVLLWVLICTQHESGSNSGSCGGSGGSVSSGSDNESGSSETTKKNE